MRNNNNNNKNNTKDNPLNLPRCPRCKLLVNTEYREKSGGYVDISHIGPFVPVALTTAKNGGKKSNRCRRLKSDLATRPIRNNNNINNDNNDDVNPSSASNSSEILRLTRPQCFSKSKIFGLISSCNKNAPLLIASKSASKHLITQWRCQNCSLWLLFDSAKERIPLSIYNNNTRRDHNNNYLNNGSSAENLNNVLVKLLDTENIAYHPLADILAKNTKTSSSKNKNNKRNRGYKGNEDRNNDKKMKITTNRKHQNIKLPPENRSLKQLIKDIRRNCVETKPQPRRRKRNKRTVQQIRTLGMITQDQNNSNLNKETASPPPPPSPPINDHHSNVPTCSDLGGELHTQH